jgi:signal peptidase I
MEDKGKKKGAIREWTESILFAVIVASVLRWLLMEAFTIPTPSMENSLLVGDFLFVNKLSYGARTPITPLQIPLTHAKIWSTNIPSYLTWIQLPQYRLPALGKVERNDVVVFNYPREFEHPIDLKTHYIKRCVAIPGDTIEIKQGQVYINNQQAINPKQLQFRYFVFTEMALNDRVFESLGIWEYNKVRGGYFVLTTPSNAQELGEIEGIQEVRLANAPETMVNSRIFPNSMELPWNVDHFGPLQLPQEGQTIDLTAENIEKYGSTIVDYEGLKEAVIIDSTLFVGNEKLNTYTFKQNYYFMMGDNRHNSEDSRFYGFVPEDHIAGKASFIWLSIDGKKSFFSKFRWNRIFTGIN